MTDWRDTRYGRKLISLKLRTGFDPTVALRVTPAPGCPLCQLNSPPDVVGHIHSARFAGDSYPILIEKYADACREEEFELSTELLSRHFGEHFVVRRRS